jgi:hypothetical protein
MDDRGDRPCQKDVFQVAVANRAGRILDRQRFRRRRFERFVDTLVEDPDVIMESSAELVLPIKYRMTSRC